jgi:hypothetical protein
MTAKDLGGRGLATVDVRGFAGVRGIHSDSSAGALDSQ